MAGLVDELQRAHLTPTFYDFKTIVQANPLREVWDSRHLFESRLPHHILLSQLPLQVGLETVMWTLAIRWIDIRLQLG